MRADVIVVNGKFLAQETTGVQRYAQEIVSQWRAAGRPFSIEKPGTARLGVWEQRLSVGKDSLLWCPTNTGPLLEKRKVVTLHDCAVFYKPEWFSWKYRMWRKAVIPRLVARSEVILTVSHFSKSVIVNSLSVPSENVHVIHNGVNTEFFKPTNPYHDLKKRYSISKPYILTVGSLDPRKNLRGIFDAWRMLPKSYREAYQLLVVGGKPKSFSDQAVEVPKEAVLTGYVPDEDLPALYTGATAFVYPSLFEGFGLPVLEAMACELPVLTSNTTALPEAAGDAALLIDPSKTEAIAEGMQKLMQDETYRDQLKQGARAHASQFQWQKSAEMTWNILQAATK